MQEQPAAKPQTDPSNNIGTEIELFVNQIDALAETLPLATVAIHNARTAARLQLGKFYKEECKVISKQGTITNYHIDEGLYTKYQRYNRRLQRAELAQTLVPRSLLVALVSQFDAYVGALIRQLFRLKPDIINASARNLTFSQLNEFSSIEAAREYVVEKEVESVLRESHSDQFDWLENKFGLPLRKDLPAWPVFVEVMERRNLFVHANGVVSRQYLEVCRRHACLSVNTTSLGQSLPLTREYFTAAYECLLEIGVKLGQVLWRKVQPNELEKADGNLVVVTYNLISEGRYQLARILLDFGTETLKAHATDDLRLRLLVNRAQTYKWTGEEEKCRKILDAEDWTAKALKFKLAYSVLRDDFEEAQTIVRDIGADDREVSKHAYRDWPLFKELRKSPHFAALFEDIFGEPLNKVVIQNSKSDGSPSPQVN